MLAMKACQALPACVNTPADGCWMRAGSATSKQRPRPEASRCSLESNRIMRRNGSSECILPCSCLTGQTALSAPSHCHLQLGIKSSSGECNSVGEQ